jgi:hypothetical protein
MIITTTREVPLGMLFEIAVDMVNSVEEYVAPSVSVLGLKSSRPPRKVAANTPPPPLLLLAALAI